MKALVVDDDPRIIKTLTRVLSDEYIVDSAPTAHQAEYLAFNNYYDVILLDLLLPDMDGEDLAGILKTRVSDTPIIAITGKSSASAKQHAFESGVDDYLVKPLSARELKARIKAHVRKRPGKKDIGDKKYKIRDLVFDKDKKMVFYKENWIKLRKKELQVLEYLIVNRSRVISRDDILENVWDAETNPFTNTVDVHIKRLREKLETPYHQKYIHTIHGLGYLFE